MGPWVCIIQKRMGDKTEKERSAIKPDISVLLKPVLTFKRGIKNFD
jgi:hypothetical protein